MTCFTRATHEGLFRQTVAGWQCQPVFLFLRPWVDPADMFPERRDPAEYEHDQRPGEVQNQIVHVARARAGVPLRDLDRGDAEDERGCEKEDAPLPAEQRGQEYAKGRKCHKVAQQVEHDQAQ